MACWGEGERGEGFLILESWMVYFWDGYSMLVLVFLLAVGDLFCVIWQLDDLAL